MSTAHSERKTGQGITDFGLLDGREPQVKRLEKGEQSPSELGGLESLFEPARVQQRTLEDFEDDVVVPLGVISTRENLPVKGCHEKRLSVD